MRLYDTLHAASRRAPSAAGPGRGCTSAARPSTSAPTSATRGRSSSACGCGSWLRHRGYDVTLVHNITDVNDKIYEAAPGASAELAEEATALVPGGHGRPRARDAGRRPGRPTTSRRSSASSRSWSTAGSPIRPSGDVYFRVAGLPGLRPPVAAAARPVGGAGAEPAEGGSARLRALEREQGGRGHFVGLALGTRPPRLAHRVLRHGRGAARPGLRDPRRWPRPRLPASRERDRAVARARTRVRAGSGCTTGCCSSSARRCPSRSGTS